MKKKTKIMELKLVRFAKKKGYTIGHLYCLGEREEEGTCDGIAGNGGAKGERLFLPFKGVKALFTFFPFYLFTFQKPS